MSTPKEDPRHGLIIRDQFVNWSDIERLYVCRRCNHLVGKPFADPITGQLDFDRIVCRGPMEHEIAEEGDLIHAKEVDYVEDKEFWNGFEVRGLYGERPVKSLPDSPLYDKDCEGW